MTTTEIIAHVALQHGMTVAQLKAFNRRRVCSFARYEAMALLRLSGLSLPQVGRALGGRHHTTVLAGLRRLAKSMREQRHGGLLRVLNAPRVPAVEIGDLVREGIGL